MKHIKIYDYEKKIETVMVNNSTNINKTSNHILTVMINKSSNINEMNNHLYTVMINKGGLVDHHC
jgi:hypothetical protein